MQHIGSPSHWVICRAARAVRWPVLCLSAALLAIPTAPSVAEAPNIVAVANGAVIDGTGAQPRPDTTIVIEGERISEVAPAHEIDLPQGAEILDAQGKWVIPGLIDAHVHFFQSGGIFARPDIVDLRDIRSYEEEIAWTRDRLEDTFARYIASGVTGAVDVGGPMWTFEARDLAQTIDTAPRVAVAGPLLGTMAPHEISGIPDPPIIAIDSAAQARAQVRDNLRHDPDMIKLWLVGPDNEIEAAMDWVRAAIAESHAAGVPVIAHATRVRLVQAVIEAGVDMLAHSVTDDVMSEDLLEEMAGREIVYVTTLKVQEGYRDVLSGEGFELSDIERRLGDPDVIASWGEIPQTRSWRRDVPSEVEAENLVRAQRHGVIVAAGSDAGNIGTLHGAALHRELELMVEAGLSELEAIAAATSGGAMAMNRAEDLGAIEAGRLADLVVLDADPTEDIRNSQRIYRVVKGGRIFDPEEIPLR